MDLFAMNVFPQDMDGLDQPLVLELCEPETGMSHFVRINQIIVRREEKGPYGQQRR